MCLPPRLPRRVYVRARHTYTGRRRRTTARMSRAGSADGGGSEHRLIARCRPSRRSRGPATALPHGPATRTLPTSCCHQRWDTDGGAALAGGWHGGRHGGRQLQDGTAEHHSELAYGRCSKCHQHHRPQVRARGRWRSTPPTQLNSCPSVGSAHPFASVTAHRSHALTRACPHSPLPTPHASTLTQPAGLTLSSDAGRSCVCRSLRMPRAAARRNRHKQGSLLC